MATVETLTTISPITNQPILTRTGLSDDELNVMLSQSADGFKEWTVVPLADRVEIVKKALDLLLENTDILAKELTTQMGRPIAYTGKEVRTAVARGSFFCSAAADALKDVPGTPENGYRRHIKKCALGTILILFSWNYPYLILMNSLIPALLTGNSVLMKPSPQTPTIVEHICRIFRQAGVPQNAIQYFHSGSQSRIEGIIQSPYVKHVCFTGSLAAGLSVKRASSTRVELGVGLELGGKDPAYVRADVDIAWAAGEIVDGAVFNSGQSCCSIERVYVAEQIHDQFVDAVKKVVADYQLGDPFDTKTHVGPVVSSKFATTIRQQVQDALDKGAKDVTPENRSFLAATKDSNYVAPTILINVDHTMNIMIDETFGPIIPIMKVSDDADAIAKMNDSQFGLTASVWTRDVSGSQQLLDQIEAGTVFINRCDFPSPDLAWTGWKDSGKGHTLSVLGFDQFVKLKSYHIKEAPGS